MFDAGPSVVGGEYRVIRINVRGVPRPQGSVRTHPVRLADGTIVGTAVRYSEQVKQWRAQLYQTLADTDVEPFEGPVRLELGFELPRPAIHFGTGKNANRLRPSALPWPVVAPDIDKLARCVADAITDARIWKDDSQVVLLHAAKRYTSEQPGVLITIANMIEEAS